MSKASIFGCLIAALGAIYPFAVSGRAQDRQSGGGEIVIAADQKDMFLAYVRRRKAASDLRLESVSVGDVLPDANVRYYDIPLYYGAPFYRWAAVGGKAVIVDPATRRILEVID